MTEPNSIGPHRPDRYRGWLVFDYLPPDLQDAEDTRQAADHELMRQYAQGLTPAFSRIYRPRRTTPAERTLLAHLGFALPDKLVTLVSYRTNGIRCRRWPQLELATGEDWALRWWDKNAWHAIEDDDDYWQGIQWPDNQEEGNNS